MHTSSRLGLDVVEGSDNVSAYPTADAQAKGILDNAAMFLTGTLVNRPIAGTYGRWYLATDDSSSGSPIGTAWFDNGSAWSSGWNPPSRGAVSIATSESRTNVAYGTMATPDQVAGIVVPTNGLIRVRYQATWQESVSGAARAAIFIGATQLKIGTDLAATALAQAAGLPGGATTGTNRVLTSAPFGLVAHPANNAYGGDVTTGQAVGIAMTASSLYHEINGTVQQVISGTPTLGAAGGACEIFLAAGTYTVGVQFKASSGSVTVQNRRLWVEAVSYA